MEVISHPPSTDRKPSKGIRPIIMGVLLGVSSLLVYLFLGAQNDTLELKQSLTTQVEQLSATQIRLDSITGVLNTRIADVRRLGGSVASLEKLKAQLEDDKQRLTYDLSFSQQKYDAKIRDYTRFLALKENDLKAILAEKNTLISRTRALEEEREQVLSENTGLRFERETLAKAVATVSAQNDDLKQKVTVASALKAINLQVLSLNESGKERRGGVYRSSKTDRLKISFVLAANSLASRTTKDIYLRLLDANGSVLSDTGIGGILTYEGEELGYSLRQPVLFENNDQRVDLTYRRDLPYKPGRYTAELYAEGFKIGSGSFEMR